VDTALMAQLARMPEAMSRPSVRRNEVVIPSLQRSARVTFETEPPRCW
jgi:hypothetical protein